MSKTFRKTLRWLVFLTLFTVTVMAQAQNGKTLLERNRRAPLGSEFAVGVPQEFRQTVLARSKRMFRLSQCARLWGWR